MKPTESVSAFEEAIEAAGLSLLELTPLVGVERMLSFYEQTPAEGCLASSEDTLLYEWGIYNWGEGESFEFGLTRQFIEHGAEGEPEVSQLRLVFKFTPGPQMKALGEGNQWCASRSQLPEFKDYIQTSKPFKALAEQEAPSIGLSHSYA